MKLTELQEQAKRRHLNEKNKTQRMVREARRKPKDEAWEAKVMRIKATAEKINKAIGLPL